MTTTATTRSPLHPARALPRTAAPLLLALAACPGGGNGTTAGGVGSSGPIVDVDFALCGDLRLGRALPGDVRHADLDGDQVADLIDANFRRRLITVAIGNADGTFTAMTELPTVGYGRRLDLGDVDGDGMLDIAVVCQQVLGSGEPAVQVFRQGPNPAEFSSAPITLILRADPTDIACAPKTGEADAEGPVELLVALGEAREVARIELSGEELIQTGALESSFLGVAGSPLSLALVDVTADGLSDLIVGEERVPGGASDRVIHYPRTAAGFGDPGLLAAPVFRPWVDDAGDVDGNGHDDVSVVQRESEGVLLLAFDEAGLDSVTRIDFGGETTSLIFPDLDGDGLAEAVGTVRGSVQVRLGARGLSWLDPLHYHVGPRPRAIGALVLPGDSIPSLLCGNAQDLAIMVAMGAADFRAARGYDTGAPGPATLRTADLDNDGDVDAVTIARFQESISFLEGAGDGTFEARVVLPGKRCPVEESGCVAIVDLNCDGTLDVLTSVFELDEVRLYRGGGSVASFRDPLPEDVFTVGAQPLGIAAADLNHDGQPDLLVCNSGDGTLQTLLNVGDGELEPEPPLALGFAPRTPVLADLDADAKLDAVILAEDGAGGFLAVILRGDGRGGFAAVETHPLPGPSDVVTTGDLDEDGRPDVVFGQKSSTADELIVLLSKGDLRFEARPIPVAAGPGAVVVADIDNDAHLDLLVATTHGELRFLFGGGTGAFPSAVRSPGELPQRTAALSYVDVDGDELEDLIMVGPETSFLWVARNTSTARP